MEEEKKVICADCKKPDIEVKIGRKSIKFQIFECNNCGTTGSINSGEFKLVER